MHTSVSLPRDAGEFSRTGVQDGLEALRRSDNGVGTQNRHMKEVKTYRILRRSHYYAKRSD